MSNDTQSARASAVAAEWNAMAKDAGLPLVTAITPARRTAVKARLAEHGPDAMTEAIRKIGASEFCRSGKWCGFDWLMKQANFTKVLEGNYDGNPTRQPMGRNDGPRPVQYRRDPAWDGLKRLHAELEAGGIEALEGH